MESLSVAGCVLMTTKAWRELLRQGFRPSGFRELTGLLRKVKGKGDMDTVLLLPPWTTRAEAEAQFVLYRWDLGVTSGLTASTQGETKMLRRVCSSRQGSDPWCSVEKQEDSVAHCVAVAAADELEELALIASPWTR